MAAVLFASPAVLVDPPADSCRGSCRIARPAPLAWEDGWLSTPLWFLRALVLVLLLTPVLRPIGQRLPGWLMFAGWLVSCSPLD